MADAKPEVSKPTFNIQLVREVVRCGPDGTATKRTESMTAQIKWDTKDGQPPKRSMNGGWDFAGDWRILE